MTTAADDDDQLRLNIACLHCGTSIVCSDCGCPTCAADKDAPSYTDSNLCDLARDNGWRCGNTVTHQQVVASDKRAARLVRFSQPPAPIVATSPDVGGSASCPIHILNLFAGIDNAGRTLTELHFDFAKIVAHFELDEALAALLRAKGTAPVFADVNDIFSVALPWFNCIFASPPCQPWSIRGDAKGVHDPRAATLPRIHQALLRFKPRGVVVEMVDGTSRKTALLVLFIRM
jgi:hypothetical protein